MGAHDRQPVVPFLLWCHFFKHSREWIPSGNRRIPSQDTSENDVPFPKVGYVVDVLNRVRRFVSRIRFGEGREKWRENIIQKLRGWWMMITRWCLEGSKKQLGVSKCSYGACYQWWPALRSDRDVREAQAEDEGVWMAWTCPALHCRDDGGRGL